MALPTLSPEQRQEALAKATQARKARSAFKDRLAEGNITFVKAVEECRADESLAKMRVQELLRALPKIGPKRCDELMTAAKIAPGRRIKGLGARQIANLEEALKN